MPVTHSFVSPKVDGPDGTRVLPSFWNDGHVVDLTADDIAGAANVLLAPYSAVGDGATDDTAAIQAAIDSGNDVYLPGPNTYALRGTVQANNAGQHIFGGGVLAFDPGGVRSNALIELIRVSAPRVRIEGLTFDGLALTSYSIAPPAHDWFIVFDDGGAADDGRVINCTFRRMALLAGHFAAAIGVLGQTTTGGCIVAGCHFLDLGGAIFMQAQNCTFVGNVVRAGRDAAVTLNSDNARGGSVIGNVFIGLDPYPAVMLEEGAYDWTVTGNIFRDCSRGVVFSHAVYGGAALGGGIIADNVFIDLQRDAGLTVPGAPAGATVGVHITSPKYKDIRIIGNRFVGLQPVAATPAFIVVEADTEGLTIDDNLFEGKAQAVNGVVFGSGTHDRFAFRRNTVRSDSAGTKLAIGIWLQSLTFTRSEIRDNLFQNITNQAVKVDGAGFVGVMADNRFETVGAAYGPAGPVIVVTPPMPHWYDNSAAGLAGTDQSGFSSGSWTPVVRGTSAAGAGTYTTQAGSYLRIGKQIYVQGRVAWSAHSGTGNLEMTGIPFTIGGALQVIPVMTVIAGTPVLLAQPTADFLALFGANTIAPIALPAAGDIILSGIYQAA